MKAYSLIKLRHGSRQDPKVTVRLQVWHYSERGRCPEFNDGLARLFSHEALGDWTPRSTKVVEPDDISIRDEYVPVEVDFEHVVATYNNPQRYPESGVRDIFKKFAPPIVYDYFVSKIQSPPHAMNIYAVANGEEITEMHIKMKYAHSYFFFPLEIRLERFLKPAIVCQEDIIMEMMRAGVDSLPVLGSLLLTYMAFQGAKIPEGTDYLATSEKILSQLSSKLPWLKDMLDNVNNTDENGTSENTLTSSGVPVLLCEASTSFEKLREIAGGLKPRLEKLSSQEGLTNQGIVRTILDLRQATIHLSEYEKTMTKFNDEEVKKLGKEAGRHGTFFIGAIAATIGFAALAALAFWNPAQAQSILLNGVDVAGQIAGVGGAAISGLGTAYQYQEKSKALVKCREADDRASAGRISLQSVFEALRQVQATLALVYIEQVMRQPIKCLGDEELERAVKMLGGDLQYLGHAGYRQALIKDRLDNLIEASMKLDLEYQRTMGAMNIVMDIVGSVVETNKRDPGRS